MKCFIIRKIVSILIHSHNLFHHRWFYKRKKIKIHLSILIFQDNFFNVFFFCSRWLTNHIYFLVGQNFSKTVNSRSTVVVSADHHNHSFWNCLCQLLQKLIKNFHCLCRWNCFIVNIPCDHNGIRLFPTCHLDNFRQNIFLIFSHVMVHEF